VQFKIIKRRRSRTENPPVGPHVSMEQPPISKSSTAGRDGQAELASLSSYIARWFSWPEAVTHPVTNRVGRRAAISLLKMTALPLSQIANRINTMRTRITRSRWLWSWW